MIETRIRQFIAKHNLIRDGEKLLIAYSGGPDSTALLMVLKQMYQNVAAVYVNHRLRGKESVKEEKFATEFCKQHAIPLFVETMRWKKRPSDLEQSARKRRYRHLMKVAKEHGFEKVALAHHRDDAVETFLLNLTRGAGPMGLGSLKPQRNIYIRPMLDCTRQEILQYLSQKDIAFFTDNSNSDLSFRRNRIRQELIPYIEKHLNPAFPAAIYRTAAWIQEQNELLSKLLEPYERLIKRHKNSWTLKRSEWSRLGPELQKALMRKVLPEISSALRLTSKSLQTLLECISTGQEMELPGFITVRYSETSIFFVRKTYQIGASEMDVPSPGKYHFAAANATLRFSVTKRTDYNPSAKVAYLDAERASFPLYIRNWKKGDSFRPLGMKGHKKLSDFLIDRKVPQQARKSIPLVYKDDDLIWLAGHQIHDDYKVKPSTRKLLRIEVTIGA